MNARVGVEPVLRARLQAVESTVAIAAEASASDLSLNLIANENRPSNTALSLIGSPISARYLLGRATERNNCGPLQVKAGLMLKAFPELSNLQVEAENWACSALAAKTVDFRPLSGLHATISSLFTFTKPGDLVYSIDPLNGGHFATGSLLGRLGRVSAYLPWDLKRNTIDLHEFVRMIGDHTIKPIVLLDHGTPLFPLPVTELRELLGDATIIYDGSHTLGLTLGGRFQNPLNEGADVYQANTHKTFPGPQKALMAFRHQDDGDKLDATISSALISSAHTHHIAALCLTMQEMRVHGVEYAAQVVENAQHLAEWLSHLGVEVFRVDGEATQSHLLILNGFGTGEAYRLCRRLNEAGITVNARIGANGEFIRIGVQEITRRGVKRSDVRFIAEFIALAAEETTVLDELRTDIADFMSEFRAIHYSFDSEWQMFKPQQRKHHHAN